METPTPVKPSLEQKKQQLWLIVFAVPGAIVLSAAARLMYPEVNSTLSSALGGALGGGLGALVASRVQNKPLGIKVIALVVFVGVMAGAAFAARILKDEPL